MQQLEFDFLKQEIELEVLSGEYKIRDPYPEHDFSEIEALNLKKCGAICTSNKDIHDYLVWFFQLNGELDSCKYFYIQVRKDKK